MPRDGQWQKALIGDFKDGQFSVRFASPAERQEAWVAEGSIRAVKEEPDAAANPPAPLTTGTAVKVEWKRRWWPAKVLKVDEKKDAQFYVAFDGYGEEWNEWVAPERIRRRR